MILDGFPNQGQTVWSEFYAARNSSGQAWVKPHWASWVYIAAIGPGGGGGGGASGAAGTARGGGGGGGCGLLVKGLFPAFSLPDVLFVFPGAAGAGGAAGVAGSGGISSVVCAYPSLFSSQERIIDAQAGGGGGAGTSSAGGTGGAGGGQNFGPWTQFGILHANSAQAGAAGGAQTGAAGGAQTVGFNIFGTGACGGAGVGTAGTEFAGGGITNTSTSGKFATILGGTAGGGIGQAGLNHGRSFKALVSGNGTLLYSGGTGGGSSNTGTGGAGGAGAYGCGGGGGGAGVTGGAGGRGGDGVIIIGAW